MPLTDQQRREFRKREEAAIRKREAEHQAELRRQEQASLVRAREAGGPAEEEERKEALRAWLINGGTEADFNKRWPQLYREIVYQRTLIQMVNKGPGGRFRL